MAILGAVTAGAVVASSSAVAIAWSLGASPAVIGSLAPKSVTTPIAIGRSAQIGGLPDLTAVLVVATGVLGALCAPEIAALVGVRSWRARGLAAGVAGHGIEFALVHDTPSRQKVRINRPDTPATSSRSVAHPDASER